MTGPNSHQHHSVDQMGLNMNPEQHESQEDVQGNLEGTRYGKRKEIDDLFHSNQSL